MAVLNFDASTVPEPNYDPLPAGDYLLWITESDIPTDQEGNQKVEVTCEVIEPQQYAGRKVWDSFTLENHQNPKWAETGRQILATLCRAVGVMSPRETEEMHGIPFCARLEVDTWKDGSLHNKVVARWSTSSQAPPQKKPKGAPPAAPQAPRPGAQTGYMPQAPQYQPQQPQYAPPQQQRPSQAPQQPGYTHQPPPNYHAPQNPPAGAAYPGPGGQPGQWAPQQPQQAPYQQPSGPPAWAQPQQPPQGQPPQPPSGEVPF